MKAELREKKQERASPNASVFKFLAIASLDHTF